jgi:SAM-dependent methyltransferase
MSPNSSLELQRIYDARFSGNRDYRQEVWSVLVPGWFGKYVTPTDTVLDLGCGYGEFINTVRCAEKLAMDLNPDARRFLEPDVRFLQQDCSTPWSLPDRSLDVVFTSNFFEHLADKAALGRTLDEIGRCLRPGGRLLAMGPNVKYLPGRYWDFWDHYIPLTEASLSEALALRGFTINVSVGRFLPYTLVGTRRYPLVLVRAYLRLPWFWRFFGRQFFVAASRP